MRTYIVEVWNVVKLRQMTREAGGQVRVLDYRGADEPDLAEVTVEKDMGETLSWLCSDGFVQSWHENNTKG